jgi:hypothetical protein
MDLLSPSCPRLMGVSAEFCWALPEELCSLVNGLMRVRISRLLLLVEL